MMLLADGTWDSWAPGWLRAIVGTLVAVTAIAALSRKPPLSWIGHWIAFVLGRLAGEPIAKWFNKLICAVIDERVDPKLDHLHDCFESEMGELKEQVGQIATDADAAVRTANDTNRKVTDIGTWTVDHAESDDAGFRNARTRDIILGEHVGLSAEELLASETDVHGHPMGLLGGDGSVR
jgi:hypothetical protein